MCRHYFEFVRAHGQANGLRDKRLTMHSLIYLFSLPGITLEGCLLPRLKMMGTSCEEAESAHQSSLGL